MTSPRRPVPRPLHLAWLSAALAAGCSSGSSTPPVPDGANTDPLCQPIAIGTAADGTCFLPYPSSFYQSKDAASPTGYRVAIPVGVLPKNQVGMDFDVTRLNWRDGWSPATTLVADLGVRVDRTKLPAQSADYGKTVLPSSPVQIIAFDTGERVPLFAEVDANADGLPMEKQALLIRPMSRMKPATRYVAALVNLVDESGKPIAVTPFRALVEDKVNDGSRLKDVQPRYAEIFAMLEKNGVPRDSLTLAWDFVTASDEQGFGNVLAMRDAGLARWTRDKLGYQVTKTTDLPNDTNVLRTIEGTFDVPSFLSDNTSQLAGLEFDAMHHPVDTGTNYAANFVMAVPKCAATAQKALPIVLWGHGLFGNAYDVLDGTLKSTAQQLCMVLIASDWVGLSNLDHDTVVSKVFGSFDTFWIPNERMQQAHLNFHVLARLARTTLKDMPDLALNGKPIVDGAEVYYYGISQGAIAGNTFMALSPDVDRAALNVAGGVYSLMISRSEDFGPFKAILNYTYPPQIQQQMLLAISQNYWDYTDPISYVTRTYANPFNGTDGKPLSKRKILIQESHDDDEVPNLTTRMIVRGLGVPLLLPKVESIYGVPEAQGPLDAAYSQWDVKPSMLPPESNTYPANSSGAHDGVSKLPQAVDQISRLFKPDGQVVDVCGGPCIYPLGH